MKIKLVITNNNWTRWRIAVIFKWN